MPKYYNEGGDVGEHHLQYSLNRVSADLFLFPKIKLKWAEKRMDNISTIQKNVTVDWN